ncbi:MAG: hypothetical protein C4303_05935, partial [candidate division GAL15 bacterium]
TPLQVVRMTAAVANGGLLLRPKVVREVRDADGAVIVPPKVEVVRRVSVSVENLAIMREAMRQAVADGTAAQAQVPGVQVAGKTGSAETARGRPHAWFAGYAPASQPRIVVVVLVEHGYRGGVSAAPIARAILERWWTGLRSARGGNLWAR